MERRSRSSLRCWGELLEEVRGEDRSLVVTIAFFRRITSRLTLISARVVVFLAAFRSCAGTS